MADPQEITGAPLRTDIRRSASAGAISGTDSASPVQTTDTINQRIFETSLDLILVVDQRRSAADPTCHPPWLRIPVILNARSVRS
jgi:hypothetical protein